MTPSSRLAGPGLWTRLAACVALACGPLAVALLTEGRWAGGDSRAVVLLALALALATGAVLLLRAGDARRAREAAAPERALRQARDQQAATAEILGAMAASPPDLQRVLDTIARNAARVCDGLYALVIRVDGAEIRLAAHHGLSPARLDALNQRFPTGLDDGSLAARAIRDACVVHCPDIPHDPGVPSWLRELAQSEGFRSLVVVPMLGDGRALGTLNVSRPEGGFTERQIELLRTFAAQAVIAIENVRLFTELGTRNRELTEALEQQTATAEILGVISRSPTNLEPVLETVARNASRLCGAANVSLYRVEGRLMRKVAEEGPPLTMLRVGETRLITRTSISGRVIVDRTTVHVPDYQSTETIREYPDVRRDTGIRTTIGIPLLREGAAIGAFTAYRTEPRSFSEREIALLQTFADQAVIAIENVRLFTALEARNRELTESLEQQTATAEILRVISTSPTNLEPVLDAVVRSAARFCGAPDASVFRLDGEVLRAVAHHGPVSQPTGFLVPVVRGSVAGRSLLERRAVRVTDLQVETEEFPEGSALARQTGQRATLGVPLLREGVPVGAILLRRAEAVPFTDKQIELLNTFADQAVIAIENVRLFTELEARNRELTEALEQQTATAEILRVISSSPTDVQPVFDSIIERAVRLADGVFGAAFSFDGELVHLVAHHGLSEEALALNRRVYPMAPGPGQLTALAVLERRVMHLRDVDTDPDVPEMTREYARVMGFRSLLAVPMLREGRPVGVLTITRATGEFAARHIELVKTFADQAVIAIENVRLFTELGARNRELTESLEQQTATSEILRAISASPTDTQPVFDSIVKSTVRLCEARFGAVFAFDGELVHLVAHHNLPETLLEVVQAQFPMRPTRAFVSGRAILSGSIVQIPHVDRDPELNPEAGRVGIRSLLAVPILRGATPIGSIVIYRQEPGPFADKQIAVLKTFADQGVIAVENVRLFRELEARTRELARSVEELQALSEVGRAVSSTLDLPTVLATIVARAVQLSGTSSGVLYEYDEATQTFQLQASHETEIEVVEALRASPIQLGEGATGRAVVRRAPVEVVDILEDQQFKPGLREILSRLGYRSILSIPLLLEQRILGALTVSRREPGHFPPETVSLLQTFATQSALAIQNARLFREIEAKGRELEVASRHKSQFLANMSHELRTPLNAVLGYTELLIDGIYGELSPKAGDVMTRIDRSGKHLLGLINDVLDLSKIEAGQLELALADYALGEVVHAVVTQVESLAAEKGLILQAAVVPDLPAGRGDERRLAQVLLNLVGNAIKFTEIGSVRIAAHRDGDAFVVSVADSGPGIAEADRQRIFEEFQQADTSSTRKKGGTGLGLSIAKRIIELHGGHIWVESTVGRGSVFSFRVPVRVDRQAARA